MHVTGSSALELWCSLAPSSPGITSPGTRPTIPTSGARVCHGAGAAIYRATAPFLSWEAISMCRTRESVLSKVSKDSSALSGISTRSGHVTTPDRRHSLKCAAFAPAALYCLCLAFPLVLFGCGDSSLAPPTSPTQLPSPVTPAPPPPPSLSHTRFNGDVYDTASRRVAGATVEILDGPQAGVVTTTDDAGRFSFMGSFDDTMRVRASKSGHVSKTQTIRVPCEMCARYAAFQLELEMAPIDLSGRYTLSFIADSAACAGIPEAARARSYNATIARHPTVPWMFDVSVSDLSVLHGYAWEGINMSVAGNYVSMYVGDAHGVSGLIEQVSPDAYVGFVGGSGTSVETSFSTVSMPFDGLIEYCKQPTGSPSPTSSGTYRCLPTQPSVSVRCISKQHTFHWSRQ